MEKGRRGCKPLPLFHKLSSFYQALLVAEFYSKQLLLHSLDDIFPQAGGFDIGTPRFTECGDSQIAIHEFC